MLSQRKCGCRRSCHRSIFEQNRCDSSRSPARRAPQVNAKYALLIRAFVSLSSRLLRQQLSFDILPDLRKASDKCGGAWLEMRVEAPWRRMRAVSAADVNEFVSVDGPHHEIVESWQLFSFSFHVTDVCREQRTPLVIGTPESRRLLKLLAPGSGLYCLVPIGFRFSSVRTMFPYAAAAPDAFTASIKTAAASGSRTSSASKNSQ